MVRNFGWITTTLEKTWSADTDSGYGWFYAISFEMKLYTNDASANLRTLS